MEMEQQPGQFKPNIYPLMYWALAFGAISGVALFLVFLLSRFITIIWFPVFLAGMVWGGYRNYKQQKEAWVKGTGEAVAPQSPMQEFKQAVGDVVTASRQMMAEQRAEDQTLSQQAGEEPDEPAPAEEITEQPQAFVAPPKSDYATGQAEPPKPFVPPQPPAPPQNLPPQNQPPAI